MAARESRPSPSPEVAARGWRRGDRCTKPFQGSQMSAALAFLTSHSGRVSPITLTLGGNDATALSEVCNQSLACMRARAPGAIVAFASRLGSILHQLRRAAPHAEIIVTGAWNEDVTRLAQTDPLYQALDLATRKAAAAWGAAVRRHASGLQSVRERSNGEGPNLCSDLRLFTGRRPSNRCRVQSDGGRRPGRFVPHSWEVGASARLKQSPWTGAGTTACPQERVTASTPVDH